MPRATEDQATELVEYLKAYKEALEIPWGQIAEEVGVSASSLANWRSGETRPTGKNLDSLLKWTKQAAKTWPPAKEPAKKLAARLKPVIDMGVAVSYAVVISPLGGGSGSVPSATGLLHILEEAGLQATVAPYKEPGEFALGVAIRQAVREELRVALSNGVSLSLS